MRNVKTWFLLSSFSFLLLHHASAEDTNLIVSRSVMQPVDAVKQAIVHYCQETTNRSCLMTHDSNYAPGLSFEIRVSDFCFKPYTNRFFGAHIAAATVASNETLMELSTPLWPTMDPALRTRLEQHLSIMYDQIIACIGSTNQLDWRVPERRTFSPGPVEVICELRAYRIDGRKYTEKEFQTLLKSTDQRSLVWQVSGFLWEIVSPPQFAGKTLTSHFDGPLASGDPFAAFSFKKRYIMDIPEDSIGDEHFRLCY